MQGCFAPNATRVDVRACGQDEADDALGSGCFACSVEGGFPRSVPYMRGGAGGEERGGDVRAAGDGGEVEGRCAGVRVWLGVDLRREDG